MYRQHFPIVVIVSIYVQNYTPKCNSTAPRRFEILAFEAVHNDREYVVKQRNLKIHPKIYDSTIDVYDRGDFGKALRRHDVQIIPAAPLPPPPSILFPLDVSSLVVCFLLFRLDDPRKTKQFGGCCRAWRAHRRDSISQGCSLPLISSAYLTGIQHFGLDSGNMNYRLTQFVHCRKRVQRCDVKTEHSRQWL